jgi:calcium-dependent protein kinase
MNGVVEMVEGRVDGLKYARKTLSKRNLSPQWQVLLKSETEVLLSVDHPNIVRLENVFETSEDIHLVMEYMGGGELFQRLAQCKRYSEEMAVDLCRMMLSAVAYLHGKRIIHRDLKLENFLYEEGSDNVKLVDFGLAKLFDRDSTLSEYCGTFCYMAPEVLTQSYTEKADMWSMGVIAYALLVGEMPFRGRAAEVVRKVKSSGPRSYSEKFFKLSTPARDFVKALLQRDPNRRPSARSALEHPWIATQERGRQTETLLDSNSVVSLWEFSQASRLRRSVLSMMAWSVSPEAQAQLRQQFLLVDKDHSGTITMQELLRALPKHDEEKNKALFNSLDVDSSSEIDYSEFLAATLAGSSVWQDALQAEELLRKTFTRFDQDGSGKIDAEELGSALGNALEDLDGIEKVIHDVDSSGDGQIDYEEFRTFFYDAVQTEPGVADAREKQDSSGTSNTGGQACSCSLPTLLTELKPNAACDTGGKSIGAQIFTAQEQLVNSGCTRASGFGTIQQC